MPSGTKWWLTGVLLALASGGCKGDRCRDAAPAFQVDLFLPSDVGGGRVTTLVVELDAAGLHREQTLEVAGKLGDGHTSVSVDVGLAGAKGFVVEVGVQARDALGVVLARGSARFQAGGDACNFFNLALASRDAGLDAADDARRDTAGDGPADGQEADLRKADGLKADQASADGRKADKTTLDASKSDKAKPDAPKDGQGPVVCGSTPVGGCFMNLLCGADAKWHVDCAKCGCSAGGTCVSGVCKVTLSPTADSFTRKTEPNTNFGTATALELSKFTSWEQENSYIDFPIQTALPSVASIALAELKLHTASWSGRAVDAEIRLVGQAWGEQTITASNAPAVHATGPVSKETIGWGWRVLDVTAHVAQWLAAPSGTVHGLRLECVATARPRPGNCYTDAGAPQCGYSVSPRSREHSVAAERPVLEVTYK